MVNGVGTAVGYTVSIVLLAGIRERIEGNDIPYNFQGSPIVLVTGWSDGDCISRIFRITVEGGDENGYDIQSLIAAAVIAAVGIIVGVGLGLFGAKFKVEVDEKEAAVREELAWKQLRWLWLPRL